MTHGSKELDEDAAKLIALGADPGLTVSQATDDGMTTEQVIAGLEKFKSYMIHVEEYKPESLRIFDEAISQLAAVTAERDRCVAALIRIATDAAVGDDAHDPKDRPMNIAAQALTPKEPST